MTTERRRSSLFSQGANERTPLLLPPEDSLPTDGIDVQSLSAIEDEEASSQDHNEANQGSNTPVSSPVKVVLVLVVGMFSAERLGEEVQLSGSK
jgi:hypothetical protein